MSGGVDRLYAEAIEASRNPKRLSSRTVPRGKRQKLQESEARDSEYFYLKTRDYVTFLRSTLGFSRFHERRPEHHTAWRTRGKGPGCTYLYTAGKGYLAKMIHLGMGLAIDGNYNLDDFAADGFETYMSSSEEPPATLSDDSTGKETSQARRPSTSSTSGGDDQPMDSTGDEQIKKA